MGIERFGFKLDPLLLSHLTWTYKNEELGRFRNDLENEFHGKLQERSS